MFSEKAPNGKAHSMARYTLLTGSTGLVGRYLLRDFLQAGHYLALVVRPHGKARVEQRVESILQHWEQETGDFLPRPVVFAGDVAEPGLGLDRDACRWISQNCDRVLHNAAVLTFHGSDRQGEPWRTNLQGTKSVLGFCRKASLKQFHYVSTAYVAGRRDGLVLEDELDEGQDFRNDYEHCKCLAEKAVRSDDFIDLPTIYRPAVIAGDSKTGYTNTYHGLFVYLRVISLALAATPVGPDGRRHTPLKLPLTGDEQRNIVPVDWVSRTILNLFENSAAHGKTYHLTPRVPLTTRNLFEAAYSYFNSYGVEFCGAGSTEQSKETIFDLVYANELSMYRDYELTDPQFDTTNLQQFAGQHPCPEIDEAVLHRYWRFGEADRWGKRRAPDPTVPGWAKDLLAGSLMNRNSRLAHKVRERSRNGDVVGLNIIGPGGGQWRIRYNGEPAPIITPGLPENGSEVLNLTVKEIA